MIEKVVRNLATMEAEGQRVNLRCCGISEGSVGATVRSQQWEGKGNLRTIQFPVCNTIRAGGAAPWGAGRERSPPSPI